MCIGQPETVAHPHPYQSGCCARLWTGSYLGISPNFTSFEGKTLRINGLSETRSRPALGRKPMKRAMGSALIRSVLAPAAGFCARTLTRARRLCGRPTKQIRQPLRLRTAAPIWEVRGWRGQVPRQPGQVRKEAAVTSPTWVVVQPLTPPPHGALKIKETHGFQGSLLEPCCKRGLEGDRKNVQQARGKWIVRITFQRRCVTSLVFGRWWRRLFRPMPALVKRVASWPMCSALNHGDTPAWQ